MPLKPTPMATRTAIGVMSGTSVSRVVRSSRFGEHECDGEHSRPTRGWPRRPVSPFGCARRGPSVGSLPFRDDARLQRTADRHREDLDETFAQLVRDRVRTQRRGSEDSPGPRVAVAVAQEVAGEQHDGNGAADLDQRRRRAGRSAERWAQVASRSARQHADRDVRDQCRRDAAVERRHRNRGAPTETAAQHGEPGGAPKAALALQDLGLEHGHRLRDDPDPTEERLALPAERCC